MKEQCQRLQQIRRLFYHHKCLKPIFITVGLLVLISECFLRICFIQIGLSYFQRQLEGKPEIVPLLKICISVRLLCIFITNFRSRNGVGVMGTKITSFFIEELYQSRPVFKQFAARHLCFYRYTWTISCINNMHDILKSTLIKRFIYP